MSKVVQVQMCNDFPVIPVLFIITLCILCVNLFHSIFVFFFAPRKTFKVDDMLQMIEKMKVEQDSPR